MMKEKEKNTHNYCTWLYKDEEGLYRCCDSRSANHGKKFSSKEILQTACEYFHVDKEKFKLLTLKKLQSRLE